MKTSLFLKYFLTYWGVWDIIEYMKVKRIIKRGRVKALKSKIDEAIKEIADNVQINTYEHIKAHFRARGDRIAARISPDDTHPLLLIFDTEYQTIRSVVKHLDNQIQLLKGVKK